MVLKIAALPFAGSVQLAASRASVHNERRRTLRESCLRPSVVVRCVVLLAALLQVAPQLRAAEPLGDEESVVDYADWSADPRRPGPQLPPAGRSLFDHMFTEASGGAPAYRVPFPFSALIAQINEQLANTEFGGGSRVVMFPMGRSLQRNAAAPANFFKFPRLVLAVTGDPKPGAAHRRVLLKDRLYIGYVESTDSLEVISFNETAGRFEFQLVKDYRAGATPKVYYANRAICVSCHQNHAPIFPRAVWSESNANQRFAGHLAKLRADFNNQSPQANIDFPDDIGQSTLRANALVAHNKLWRLGCQTDDDRSLARRCRAAALLAALQYGLNSDSDFNAGSPRFRSDFIATFGANFSRLWPQGFKLAQAELPDRNPLGDGAFGYAGAGAGEAPADLLKASEVPAALDPLNRRPARETWYFGSGQDAVRYIAGWSRMFSSTDMQALDAQLVRRAARIDADAQTFSSACELGANQSSTHPLRLDCDDTGALTMRAQLNLTGSGTAEFVSLRRAGQLSDATVVAGDMQRAGDEFVLPLLLQRKGLTARASNGRAIVDATLRWPIAAGEQLSGGMSVRIELRMRDDFALLRNAIDRLISEQPELFDAHPLMRTTMLRALHAKLDGGMLDGCCDDLSVVMPAATIEPVPAGTAPAVRLRPLYRNCALCHQTPERFPPNFLAGDTQRVAANLRQCAPRIWARLAQWHDAPAQRAKSPMPPLTHLAALDSSASRWRAGEDYRAIRALIEPLLQAQGLPTSPAELLINGYETLPSCLPDQVGRTRD